MANIGDIGTLKELGVLPGDVVLCSDDRSDFEGRTYTVHAKHPRGVWGSQCATRDDEIGYVTMGCPWKFRLISRAAPTLWRDMTPEQRAAVPQSVFDDPTNLLQIPWGEWSRGAKGAVLLAHHEGDVTEYSHKHSNGWQDRRGVSDAWHDKTAYRVRPEPPRVDLMADGVKVGTVAMRDGKVDRDSVEWVE